MEPNLQGARDSPLVLVVDDEKVMRLQLRYALQQAGYHVLEAENGQQALEAYEYKRPDIVLLDAIMPMMDGFSCCAKLNSLPQTYHTPVLIITGLDDKESVDRAFTVGAADYITKPIHWPVLMQRVNRLIHQSKLQQQLEAANQTLEQNVQKRTEALNQTVEKLEKEIRERQQAEAALRQSEEKLRLAIEAAQVITWDWDITQQHTSWSADIRKLFGLSPEDFDGSYLSFIDCIHPDDRRTVDAAIALAQLDHSTYHNQYRILVNNEQNLWLEAKGRFFYDETTGQPIRMLGVLMDITERKQNEIELQRMASLVENSSNFISISSLDHRIIYVNSAGLELVGLESLEAAKQTQEIDYYLTSEQNYVHEKILPTVLEQGYWQGEVNFRHFQTDEAIPMLCSVFLTKDQATGKPLNFATISRDIRERKQAEQQVLQALEQERQLSELKSKFIETVSHEFRTPLAAIALSAELLEQKGCQWEPEKATTRFRRIKDNIKRITQVLDDALTITRSDTEEPKIELSAFDLTDLCHKVIADLPVAYDNQHSINFKILGEPALPVCLDKNSLRQAITQLLVNAIRYSPTMYKIELQLTYKPARVLIQVQDWGIGIPKEEQVRIFDRFYRASNANSIPGTPGMGLGLAIAKQAIELQGGTLELDSNVGQGSTFTISIPYAKTAS